MLGAMGSALRFVAPVFASFFALSACETPVRPTPPDVPDDAPLDAPIEIDAGRCPTIEGYYLASSTCPALDDASFGVCLAQDGCHLELSLATSASPAEAELDGMFGAFEDAVLATDVTCSELTVESTRVRISCVDRIGIGCELILQPRPTERAGLCCVADSACGAGETCTLVALGAGPPITTACVADEGTGTAGMACTRGASGDDDCAPGLYCTALGVGGDALACRALCRSSADCGGDACIATGTAPSMGFCVEACDVFDDAACGTGGACSPVAAYGAIGASALTGVCDDAGSIAEGERCETAACVAGTVCARNALLELRCAPPCDDGHPCDVGSCVALADGDPLGACQ